MPRTFFRQEHLGSSRTFNDTESPGTGMESSKTSIEEGLNSIRAQIKRVNWADDSGNWFDDVSTHNSKKRGLNEVNSDLDIVEVKKFMADHLSLIPVTVDQGIKASGTLTLTDQPLEGSEAEGILEFDNNAIGDISATGVLTASGNFVGEDKADGVLTASSNLTGEDFAAGVLTASGNVSEGSYAEETLTFLSNPSPGVKASGLWTVGYNQPTDTDGTVQVGDRTYTWHWSFNSPNRIKTGWNTEGVADWLMNAVNGGSGEGTTYGTGTVPHADVTASKVSTYVVKFEANEYGTAGNEFLCTASDGTQPNSGGITNSDYYMQGGEDPDSVTIDGKTYTFQDTLTNVDGNVHIGATASDTIDNLIAAITLGSGSGTDYAAATTLHSTCTAVTGAGDTMVVSAKSKGTAGNLIEIGNSVANYGTVSTSWGQHLTGGTDSTKADVDMTFACHTYGQTAQAEIMTSGTDNALWDGDTITIGSITYTFRTTLTQSTPYEVLIMNAFNQAKALDYAIRRDPSYASGYYSTATVEHPDVTSNNRSGNYYYVNVSAKDTNSSASIAISSSGPRIAPLNEALTKGQDEASIVIDGKTYQFVMGTPTADGEVAHGGTYGVAKDNLIAAINLGAGSGTAYGAATTLHPTVTATSTGTYKINLEAKSNGTAGNAIVVSTQGGRRQNTQWTDPILFDDAQTLEDGVGADTVTIGSKTYTFQETLTNVDGNVHIGATASDSLDNLVAAIILGSGAGTDYATAMTLHPTISGAAGAGDTLDATAKTAGASGNSIATTVTGDNVSWGAATLENGVTGDTITIGSKTYTMQVTLTDVDGNVKVGASASDTLDNLINAINLGSGSGSTYAASMTLHPTVTAAAGAGDTMDAEAKTAGTSGNSIATTKSGGSISWGNSTLTGGLDGETVTIDAKVYTFQAVLTNVDGNVLEGASASDSLDNLIAAITLGVGAGSVYAAAMTDHPTVTAAAGAGDTMDASAETGGTGGNSIATTDTAASVSWGGGTLSGGQTGDTVTVGSKTYVFEDTLTDVDGYVKIGASASDTIDNLIAAITLGAGAGTAYATSMTANTDVTAVVEFGDSMRVTSLLKGPDGNTVATTETGDNLVWRDATLVNGTNAGRASGDLTLASNFLGEIAAEGTLTAAANVSGGAEATHTLTLSANLEDETAATARLWATHVYNGSKLEIGTGPYVTYLVYAATMVAYNVKYDTSTGSATAENFVAAINDSGVEGTDYGNGTLINEDVSASFSSVNFDNVITLTAKVKGVIGNTIRVRAFYPGNTSLLLLGKTEVTADWDMVYMGGGKDADTITIDGKTYTFQDTLTNVDGNVHIGGSASATLDNLIDAINLGDGSGTDYAAAMTEHPTVSAVAGDGDTMDITAKVGGASGNSIAVSTSASNALWTQATLTGGDVGVAASLDVPFSDAAEGGSAGGLYIEWYDGYNAGKFEIDGKVYEIYHDSVRSVSSYPAVDGGIRANASSSLTVANALIDAINLKAASSGTEYTAGTTKHTTVTAELSDSGAGSPKVHLKSMVPGAAPFLVKTRLDGYSTGFYPRPRTGANDIGYIDGGSDGDKITIDGTTYTFVDEIYGSAGVLNNDTPNLVYKGTSATEAAQNLSYAINASGGTPGTHYSASTTAHSTVTASASSGTLTITAQSTGTGGNSIEVGIWNATSVMSLGADTMDGGGDGDTITMDSKTYTFQSVLTDVNGNVKVGADAEESLDNLIAAVNLGSGAGTKYATSMTLHSTMSAVAGAGDTMDATAKTAGTVGNTLPTTETGDDLSWGASTLEGGLNGETVTIDSKVYTMTNSLTDSDGRVLVGATANDSIDNLVAAIGLLPGANTLYANAMTIHPTCLAVNGGSDTMDVSAKAGGTAGNSISTTETATTASWGNSTLTGGLENETVTMDSKTYTFQSGLTDSDGNVKIGDDVEESIENLANAVILGPGTGTAYADSMIEHSTVTASKTSSTTMGAAAKAAGSGGNSIATTETMANGSWGDSTLGGGDPGGYAYGDLTFTDNAEKGYKASGALTAAANPAGTAPATGILTAAGNPTDAAAASAVLAADYSGSDYVTGTSGTMHLQGYNGNPGTGDSITIAGVTYNFVNGEPTQMYQVRANYTWYSMAHRYGMDAALCNLSRAIQGQSETSIVTPPGMSEPYRWVGPNTPANPLAKEVGSMQLPDFRGYPALRMSAVNPSTSNSSLAVTWNCPGGAKFQNYISVTVTDSVAPLNFSAGVDPVQFTIDGKNYRFKLEPGNYSEAPPSLWLTQAGDISAESAIISTTDRTRLINCINGSGSPGTDYATGTVVPHPSVSAAANATADYVDITAKTAGAAGNSIAVSVTRVPAQIAGWVGDVTSLFGGTDDNTVTIGSKTYTFQGELTDVDGNVHIGASASDTLDNLIDAINLGAGAGTDYATSMTLHPTVSALAGAGDTLDATAKTPGTGGNSIATTETGDDLSWGASTLEGGVTGDTVTIDSKVYTFQEVLTNVDGNVLVGASASDTLDNLIAAITLGSGSGTKYAAATTLHSSCTAAAGAGDTMDVETNFAGAYGNSIDSTETGANLSWAASTLEGGSDGEKAVGALTMGANVSGGVKADGILSASGNVDGEVPATGTLTAAGNPAGGVSAIETLTFDSNPQGGAKAYLHLQMYDTRLPDYVQQPYVNIDGPDGTGDLQYRWDNGPAGYTNAVKIGATAAACLSNLMNAINAGPGAGTVYNAAITEHTRVSAAMDGDALKITQKEVGFVKRKGWSQGAHGTVYEVVTGGTNSQGEDPDTVTIDGKTYTFQDDLTDVDGNVKIGASVGDSINNLIAAINLGSGAGTAYATSMTLHSTCSAAAGTGDSIDISAKTGGTAGNSIEVSTYGTYDNPDNVSFGPHLTGGDVGVAAALNFDVTKAMDTYRDSEEFSLYFNNYPEGSDTITVGSVTYTFVTSINESTPNQILRTTDTYALAQRVGNAINLGGFGGVVSSATVQNPLVRYTGHFRINSPYGINLAPRILPSVDITLASSTSKLKFTASGTYYPINYASITIDGKTYQFANSTYGGTSRGDGYIYATPSNRTSCKDALVAAINLGAGGGTTYDSATTLHPTVTAASTGTYTFSLTAKSTGVAGNDIEITTRGGKYIYTDSDSRPVMTPDAQTLEGGVNGGDTVTVDAKVYTFEGTLTNVDGNVHVGASASDSLDNLINAINLGSGAGTDYATAMTLHPTVSAAAGAGDTLDATAKTAGTGGNSISTTETGADLSWGASTLEGGATGDQVTIGAKTYNFQDTLTDVDGNVKVGASASDTLDNLIAAITLGSGSGTVYAASMTEHPTIVASSGSGVAAEGILTFTDVPDGEVAAAGVLTAAANVAGSAASTGVLTAAANPTGAAAATSRYSVDLNTTLGGTKADIELWCDAVRSNIALRLDNVTYRVINFLSVAEDIKGNGTPLELLTNIMHCINGTGTPGVHYHASSTSPHPTCQASAVQGSYPNEHLEITAKIPGTVGNSYVATCSDIGTTLLRYQYGTSLSGGVEPATVTLDAKTYTFQETLTNVDGNVLHGSWSGETIDNLIAAVNLGSGAGTKYATAMTLHPTVTGLDGTVDYRMDVEAKTEGTAGNSIATTVTGINQHWDGATLSGGVTGDTVTIDTKTYTYQETLTNVDGNVKVGASTEDSLDNLIAAITADTGSGTLYAAATTEHTTCTASAGDGDTMDVAAKTAGPAGDSIATTETGANLSFGGATLSGGVTGDTVTIDSKTYTFQETLTNVNGNVLEGASASDSLDNLIAAINLGAGGGSTYAAAMTLHSTVSAAAGDGDTLNATAKTAGTGGNSIATTETSSTLSWGNSTLENGENGDTVTIDSKVYTWRTTLTDVNGYVKIGGDVTESIGNIVAAINLDTGAGTKYASSMTLHSTVSGALNGSTLVATAKSAGVPGNALTTTEDGANHSWGGATLSGGLETMDAEAKTSGTGGNSIATTDTSAGLSWDNGTLTGGLIGDQVTVDAKTYTYQDVLTDTDGNILKGASASDSIDNLVAAMNLGAGGGSTYAASTTLHPTVSSTAGAGDTMDAEAKTPGTSGNSIATTETGADMAWGASTLEDGTDDSVTVVIDTKTYTLKDYLTDTNGYVKIGSSGAETYGNLLAAINLDSGAGTLYAASTTLHPTVSAAAQAADTLRATAKTGGVSGNSIATTETSKYAAWGASTLEGGIDVSNFVILSLAAGEIPSLAAAVDTVTTEGLIVAYNSNFAEHSMAAVAGQNALTPKNLCTVRDVSSGERLLSDGKIIYALLQSEDITNGHAFNDNDKRVMLSFVRENATGDALEECPAADIDGEEVYFNYSERAEFNGLDEAVFLNDYYETIPALATDVTLDNAIDGQVGAVSQAQDIDVDIANTKEWVLRDANSVDLLKIRGDAGGSTSEIEIGSAVDIYDNNAVDVDFEKGIAVGSAGIEISINETGGVISRAADLILRASGSGELHLYDSNKPAGWSLPNGIKLSENSTEWTDFETVFGGEVSILNAVKQAATISNRVIGNAVLQVDAAEDVDVDATTTSRLDVDLPDYSSVVSFLTDVDIFVNGVLMINGADAGASGDVYPGSTPSQGMLKFNFSLTGTGTPDTITMVVWGV